MSQDYKIRLQQYTLTYTLINFFHDDNVAAINTKPPRIQTGMYLNNKKFMI